MIVFMSKTYLSFQAPKTLIDVGVEAIVPQIMDFCLISCCGSIGETIRGLCPEKPDYGAQRP